MLSTDEKKIILRAMRKEAIISISRHTEEKMRYINESDILMRDLVLQIWEDAQRRLQTEQHADLIERSKLGDFD